MEKGHSRRKFLADSARAGLALGSLAAFPAVYGAVNPKSDPAREGSSLLTGFDQQPLPYSFHALEPAIDAQTMELHYTKHAAAYSNNLKEAAAAENISASMPLEELLAGISKYSPRVRNNGGGHYNHEFFWKSMKPGSQGMPSGKLARAIEKDFGSFDGFKTKFAEAAKTRFGSGWAWLLSGPGNRLMISSTPNQDNPLMDVAEVKGYPLLGLDVWEHAYYLQYQNRRADYIGAWWRLVNWDIVQSRFEKNS